MSKRVLELGNYIAPAYAGMLLAEQGFEVHKWIGQTDPILSLAQGDELWAWINHGKTLITRHPSDTRTLLPGDFGIIIDNFRPSTLERWGINPQRIAKELGVVWVSLRADVGEVSFDVIAQARAWGEFCPWLPFYAGDTIAGLWLAFKALSAANPGHYCVRQATALAKLIEGELVIEPRTDRGSAIPWDTGRYELRDGIASVMHRGQLHQEPVRDREWKRNHLRHKDGRFII